MKSSFVQISAFTIVCSLFGIASQAEALVSTLGTQTVNFSNQATELNGTPILTLNQYSGTGTLSEVDFTVTASINSSGTVTNTASVARTFTVQLIPSQYDFNVNSGAPSALINLVNPNTGGTFSPFDDSGVSVVGSQSYTNLAAGATSLFGPFTANGTSSAIFTAPADVAGFIGNGTYSFSPYTSIGTLIIGGGGFASPNIVNLASGSITVTYKGTTAATAVPFEFHPTIGLVLVGGFFLAKNIKRLKQ
jgi:hypothetical protein